MASAGSGIIGELEGGCKAGRLFSGRYRKNRPVDPAAISYYIISIDTIYGGLMATTKISPKYQVVIPKAIREKLRLKSGQKMMVVAKGGVVYLIPEKPIESFRGFLSGMNAGNVREDDDR
jgi:AbrB family looped-hinge helix DNA binding protein